MEAQEIFDTVATHLLKQGKRSVSGVDEDGDEICAYRGDDGLKCAVGCLIPDDRYDPDLEGRAAWSEQVVQALPFKTSETTERQLLRLQEIHDRAEPEEWAGRLASFAKANDLSTAALAKAASPSDQKEG